MRRPLLGILLRALGIGAVCAVLAFGGVLDPTHSVLLGCIGLAAVLVRAGAADQWETDWPDRPLASRAGGRNGVSDLGWQVFGQDGRVRAQVVDRVAGLAEARLALLGVDASDPAQAGEVERLLGPRVAAGLASGRPPTARTLQTWLNAIDRISNERTIP
jgi:hypothetical protein